MKYIKSILLLFLLFLITGCTVNYSLTIDENLNEYIHINSNIDEEIPLYYEDLDNLSEVDGKLDGYKYYNKSNNNGYTSYTIAYDEADFSKITSCNLLFDKCELVKIENGNMVLSTTTGTGIFNTYPYVDSININLTINGEVITNNADIITNNTYIWKLTPETANDKKIYVEFKDNNKLGSKNNKTEKTDKEKTKENLFYLGLLLIALVLLLVVFITIQRKKYKQ